MAEGLPRGAGAALGGGRDAPAAPARGRLRRAWEAGAARARRPGSGPARAVERLRRGLDRDDAAAGAPRGDARLGHSRPVGGAVAHRERIGVPGVGG